MLYGFIKSSLKIFSTATLKRLCLVPDVSDDDGSELSLTISFYSHYCGLYNSLQKKRKVKIISPA